MVRAGLGARWQCLFANDFDHKKGRIYRDNWGEDELKSADVGTLKTSELPGTASLAWASFPCQDLSLAGGGAGLKGDRSGTFWPFWKLMKGLVAENRGPQLIVLENVCGTLTSHGGKDFATICTAVQQADYVMGGVVVDASLFLPQSRPRLFVVAVRRDVQLPQDVMADGPTAPWHTPALKTAYENLPAKVRKDWVWWNLSLPPQRKVKFADIIEENPVSPTWFTPEETKKLLAMMSPINRAKVQDAKTQGRRIVGGVYKRTRPDVDGRKVQRAEVRFDDVAGCLRTPAGGSSRQVVVVVEGKAVKARLISSRETARLMGLPDSYKLPENYNEAYHLTGDGVVVPVVRHLAEHILEPILRNGKPGATIAA